MNAVAQQMIPLTELADTLSFGLIAKLRKKTHNTEDNVQRNWHTTASNNNNKCIDKNLSNVLPALNAIPLKRTFSNLQKLKNNNEAVNQGSSHSLSTSSENTITAAYNFNDSILADNTNSSYTALTNVPPPRQQRQLEPCGFKGKGKSTLNRSFTTSTTTQRSRKPIGSSNTPSLASTPTQTTLSKRVTISEHTTDLVSGDSYVRSSDYPRNYNYNYTYEHEHDDNSSISSLSESIHEFKFVLDDHIFPGRPETYTSVSSPAAHTQPQQDVITVNQKRRTKTN